MSATLEKIHEINTPKRKEIPFKVYCSAVERQHIETNARLSGKSLSAYLRAVGMGSIVMSALDQQAVREISKINADQGRLGGLLKALLTNDERLDGYDGQQIRELTLGTLQDIRAAQAALQASIQKITTGVL